MEYIIASIPNYYVEQLKNMKLCCPRNSHTTQSDISFHIFINSFVFYQTPPAKTKTHVSCWDQSKSFDTFFIYFCLPESRASMTCSLGETKQAQIFISWNSYRGEIRPVIGVIMNCFDIRTIKNRSFQLPIWIIRRSHYLYYSCRIIIVLTLLPRRRVSFKPKICIIKELSLFFVDLHT